MDSSSLSPTKNIQKSTYSKSPSRKDDDDSFQAVFKIKILDDKNAREPTSDENCLIQRKGTVRELVKEAQKIFIPSQRIEGNLKLRNVTTFAAKYGLDVSVNLDENAKNGWIYTAYFISKQEAPNQPESSSSSRAKNNGSIGERSNPNSPIATVTAELLNKQIRLEETNNEIDLKQNQLEEINKEVNMKQIKLEEIKNEVDLKTTLLMNIEKDLLETNKQNQSSLLTRQELDKELKTQANAYEKMQSQQDILKKETDTLKDEKKKLKDDVKAQREKIEKKNNDLNKVRASLKETEKKQKAMEQQLEVFKHEQSTEVDSLNKITSRKEKALKECEELQTKKEQYVREIDRFKRDKLELKNRLRELQKEEQKFQTMLNELHEQIEMGRGIQAADSQKDFDRQENQQLQEQDRPSSQQQEQQLNIVVNQQQGGNDPVDMSPQMTAEKLLAIRAIHPNAFTRQCNYFSKDGRCYRDNCMYIHDMSTQTQRERGQKRILSGEEAFEKYFVKMEARQKKIKMAQNNDNNSAQEPVEHAEIEGESRQILPYPQPGIHQQHGYFDQQQAFNNAAWESWRWQLPQHQQPAFLASSSEQVGHFFNQPMPGPSAPNWKAAKGGTHKSLAQKKPPMQNKRRNSGSQKTKHSKNTQNKPNQTYNDNGNVLTVVLDQKSGKRRSTSNAKYTSRSNQRDISPIRNSDAMPSTSTYGDQPRPLGSNSSGTSIIDRITIEKPKAQSSSIHDRVTYD